MTPFGDNIWLVDGPVVIGAAGFHFPTRMAVIRLPSGGLFVWSPVALTPDIVREVADLGTVAHIVAPNSLHDTFLRDWAQAFPDAMIHLAPGMAAEHGVLPRASVLKDEAIPEWAGAISHVIVPGNTITTEVVFYHLQSRTVLFTDLIQQFPRSWFRGWRRLVARLDLMTQPEPTVPRKIRLAFTDRAAARRSVLEILDWPAQNVVMAHGDPLRGNGSAFLQRAFGWLRVGKR